MVAKEEVICGQTAGSRQELKQSPTWVSRNIAKQHLTVDGGGVSNRRRETPGFLAERGFLIRLIPNVEDIAQKNLDAEKNSAPFV